VTDTSVLTWCRLDCDIPQAVALPSNSQAPQGLGTDRYLTCTLMIGNANHTSLPRSLSKTSLWRLMAILLSNSGIAGDYVTSFGDALWRLGSSFSICAYV
jgi:hypothetical protein